jgi:hypothetical protein
MGFFNPKFWKCLDCDAVSSVKHNNGFNTCKQCGEEFFVEHDNREILVTRKSTFLSRSTFTVACPNCSNVDFELSYDNEGGLTHCEDCGKYALAGIGDDGLMVLAQLDLEKGEVADSIKEINREVIKYQQVFDRIIEELFPVPVCVQCDDTSYILLQTNERYSSIQVQCQTCNKKIWIKSIDNDSERLTSFKVVMDFYDKCRETDENSLLNRQLAEQGILNRPKYELVARQTKTVKKRDAIPKKVKLDVWERDSGRCVECGSQENLEFDHIIPFSKGGANTARNIQLLCQHCNRSKQAKIG